MAPKNTFSLELTQKIADLSKLTLEQNESEYFSEQFNSTLKVINTFNKLNTEGIKGAYNITGLKNVFRDDIIDNSRMLTQEMALSNARRTHKGFFVVKGILDEK